MRIVVIVSFTNMIIHIFIFIVHYHFSLTPVLFTCYIYLRKFTCLTSHKCHSVMNYQWLHRLFNMAWRHHAISTFYLSAPGSFSNISCVMLRSILRMDEQTGSSIIHFPEQYHGVPYGDILPMIILPCPDHTTQIFVFIYPDDIVL